LDILNADLFYVNHICLHGAENTPHMLAEDMPIWSAFLDQYQSLFIRCFYDVRVGGVWPEDPSLDYNMQFMYYASTAKRIDVVAELSDEVWIVEVAAAPGLRVVGQILSYHALWV